MSDLTIKEAAGELSVSQELVRQLANRGRLRGAYKSGLGGRTSLWRIPAKALELYRSSQPQGYRE
ncbi:helix-turn-helix domain-containing protein [Glutamicibacter sp. AOP12-B1-11]|uniref:helix-turn-helix domain-containing protein n=1 Tax=Glutamicibacter sp. AOP12-B1-11 TaxID=3457725 RepID=UPI0040336228